jgi:tripartite-type tricarboxylate transporter receptor subunit TctC
MMKLPRRQFLHLAAGAAALQAVPRIARAQTYPTRPVRLIVGSPPGGVVDLYARLIGQWLSERLGQPFIIENRAGAGGNIGTEAVVRAAPDGYTLLQLTSGHSWNVALYDKLNFNFIRDIAPVASIYSSSSALLVNLAFPAKSVPELIAYAKGNPGKISMASTGVGTVGHVYGELFKMMAGVDMLHIPYRGWPLPDLLAGQVPLMFEPIGSSLEYIRSGKVRALAVTSATRAEVLPDIPMVGEFVTGYEASGWQGVGAPRNTPVEIINKLNEEINAALTDPKMKARIADLGGTVLTGSPAEFRAFIGAYTEKWAKVIKLAGIKAD